MVVLFSTAFLAPLCETLMALNTAFMALYFVLLKYVLFNRRERPPQYGAHIGRTAETLFPLSLLFLEVGGVIFNIWTDVDFDYWLYFCIQVPCIILTLIVYVLLFLNITPILKMFRLAKEMSVKDIMDESEFYYKNQWRNLSHYDLYNPLTEDSAKVRLGMMD